MNKSKSEKKSENEQSKCNNEKEKKFQLCLANNELIRIINE